MDRKQAITELTSRMTRQTLPTLADARRWAADWSEGNKDMWNLADYLYNTDEDNWGLVVRRAWKRAVKA